MGGFVRNAQVWINGWENFRLVDALARNGIPQMRDWKWTEALDVSADGRVIGGDGENLNGNLEGWVATIPLLGDANLDDVIEGGDYTLWADNYLATDSDWSQGDFNFDSYTDGADYTLWADHYAPVAAATVPEPATSVLAMIAAALVWAVRWQRCG